MGRLHSTFRTVVLVTSSVAAILFLLTAVAVARYGDRGRDFGWIGGGAAGVFVAARVDPGGPAAGLLQSGDAIVAWNGDRRVARLGAVHFRRNLPADASYTLTIRRAGVEQAVTLAAPPRPNGDQWRLSVSNLFAAFVWFVVATMIALFRPDLTVSRSAYAAGMVMGFFMLGMSRGDWLAWLPSWWRAALILVFPLNPLHVAIGYDFYVRFPPGVSTTRLWRGIRMALYVLCGVLFVFRSLVDTVMYIAAPDRVVSVRDALLPIDRWLQWPASLVFPLGGLAILAVVTRNYRAVQREDDRRRLRWVLWGSVLGLTPFLTLQLTALGTRIAGAPMPIDFGRWNPLVNLATVLIPISFGYAVIKHHVFDITFVVATRPAVSAGEERAARPARAADCRSGLRRARAPGSADRAAPVDQLAVSVFDWRGDRQPALPLAVDALARSAVLPRSLRPAADPGRVDRQRGEAGIGFECLEARQP